MSQELRLPLKAAEISNAAGGDKERFAIAVQRGIYRLMAKPSADEERGGEEKLYPNFVRITKIPSLTCKKGRRGQKEANLGRK